jgi:hypothetical protein
MSNRDRAIDRAPSYKSPLVFQATYVMYGELFFRGIVALSLRMETALSPI